MERHPITPRISDHDPDDLHLHVANRAASVADLLIGESLLGLATLVCDLGPHRLGVCSASPCTNVYVDTSPNQSRRYCSDRCSSRANVAAYRARQKIEREAAAGTAPTTAGTAPTTAGTAAETGAGSPA
jgi:predicted RNA-binding Zn ribbon-like protein